MDWPAVALDATLADFAGRTVAVGGRGDGDNDTVGLLRIGSVRKGEVRVVHADLSPMKVAAPVEVTLPADATIRDAALGLTHVRPDRAGLPPKVKWPSAWSWRTIALLIGLSVTFFVLAAVVPAPTLAFSGLLCLMLAIGGGYGQRMASIAGSQPRVIEDGCDVFTSKAYARLTVDDATPAVGGSPQRRVDRAKERLEALRGDIVYRIENSALFDGAVPHTARLQQALLGFDPLSPESARLADDVEVSLDEAIRTAEALGIDHLPETVRDPARRAARLARTALSSDEAAERAAARRRVVEILSSLSLYYLPAVDADAPALIGERKQIEPA